MKVVEQITEEMGVHKAWYEAKPKTVDELAAFVTKLLSEYNHDYGTICHAAAAAAVAACRTINADPNQGGLTGFQAGAVMWQFVRHWLHEKGPMRMQRMEHLLYPQYGDEFGTIPLDTFRWLQEEAKRRIAEGGTRLDPNEEPLQPHPDVLAHWQRIADGEVPFGLRIKD
jgi:hypothetical protein